MSEYPDLVSLHNDLRACRRCAQAGYSIQSLPVFSGGQAAQTLLIGQAPGVTEADSRRPFGGDAGRRLFKWLERAGWSEQTFRDACYITSVTKCFPGKAASGGGDRVPSAAEQRLCAAWLAEELRLASPKLVIAVGMLAIRLFYPASAKLEEIVGDSIVDGAGRRIVPLPHPSGASRWHSDPRNAGRIERAIFLLRSLKQDMGL